MGLPTKIKTWNYSVNHDVTEASVSDTQKHGVFQVKEALASFSQWSVVASSDSVSVKNIGDPSPDLWTDWVTDLVGGTGAHSWIVLENSVTGAQLCIDCNSTNFGAIEWLYSATGSFAADGTTSSRPTDTESLYLADNIQWMPTGTDGAVVNAMCSDDGKCTRVYVHCVDAATKGGFFFALEDLTGTPSQWTGSIHQAVLRMDTNTGLSVTPALQDPVITRYDNTTMNVYLYHTDSTPYEGWNTAAMTCESYHQFAGGQGNGLYSVNLDLEWNEGYPVCPAGLFRDVVTRGGGQGAFQDLYIAPQQHPALTTYPSDASRQWVKWGFGFFPWNGSVPLEVP